MLRDHPRVPGWFPRRMAVPVKRTRKPAPPVKYLLSGDRKLQRLSLKKISDPAKKAKPKEEAEDDERGKQQAERTLRERGDARCRRAGDDGRPSGDADEP